MFGLPETNSLKRQAYGTFRKDIEGAAKLDWKNVDITRLAFEEAEQERVATESTQFPRTLVANNTPLCQNEKNKGLENIA